MNLDFEAPLDPKTWVPIGDVAIDRSQRHGGAASLRVQVKDGGEFSMATVNLPTDRLRGHVVTVRAWIRTEDTSAASAFWCRSTAKKSRLDSDSVNPGAHPGISDWTETTLTLAVPSSAENVVCSAGVQGTGIQWIDDLSFEVGRALPDDALTARVSGNVFDGDKPAAGMTVRAVLSTDDRPVFVGGSAVTGADGSFQLELPAESYTLVATGPLTAGVAKGVKPAVARPTPPVTIKVGGPGHVLSGTVVDLHGKPVPHALAGGSSPIGDSDSGIFVTEADGNGRYKTIIPPGRYTPLAMTTDGLPVPITAIDVDKDRRVDVTVAPRAQLAEPAPAAVIEWLRKVAIPFATTDATAATSDLVPVARLVGKARLIGLGEATHGTAEFSRMKHRMFEYLVKEQGVTVFAFEGGFGELTSLDAYIHGGDGDAKTAIQKSIYGIWHTADLVALAEWMRAWNMDPAHAKQQIRVYGVDVQSPASSRTACDAYMKAMSTAAVPLAELGPAKVLALFDRERRAWVAKSSARDWQIARKHCDVVRQNEEMSKPVPGLSNYDEREKGMFENMMWLLNEAEPKARVAFWAHNGHVSRDGYDGTVSVGQLLSRKLGRDYVVFGFVWNQGGFGAVSHQGGWEHSVGPEAPGGIGATFATLGKPLAMVDLRTAPAGAVRSWLAAPHRARDIGALYTTDDNMDAVLSLSHSYDVAIFIDTTSAAKPFD